MQIRVHILYIHEYTLFSENAIPYSTTVRRPVGVKPPLDENPETLRVLVLEAQTLKAHKCTLLEARMSVRR